MLDLTARDIKYLQGVGPQRAALLSKELNICSLHDLLYYFPYKYVDTPSSLQIPFTGYRERSSA